MNLLTILGAASVAATPANDIQSSIWQAMPHTLIVIADDRYDSDNKAHQVLLTTACYEAGLRRREGNPNLFMIDCVIAAKHPARVLIPVVADEVTKQKIAEIMPGRQEQQLQVRASLRYSRTDDEALIVSAPDGKIPPATRPFHQKCNSDYCLTFGQVNLLELLKARGADIDGIMTDVLCEPEVAPALAGSASGPAATPQP